MAHVLIAEDEGDLRQTLRTLLEGEGYTVGEAADGQQALDMIRSSPTALVVLMDVLMPMLNGIQVLEAVAADPALAARDQYLLLTANDRPLLAAAGAVLAALGVTIVAKPFDIDDLLRAVAQAAAGLP
jgi:CheY-like chemotaxis protein